MNDEQNLEGAEKVEKSKSFFLSYFSLSLHLLILHFLLFLQCLNLHI